MARKKTDPQFLTALKERSFGVQGFPTFIDGRLAMVWGGYQNLEKVEPYIWQLMPVPLVTHLEAHFRACVEILIDAGEPYLSRAEELARNVSFNFSAVKALSGRSLTLGTVIAHSLPFSTYAHFEAPITCLLGSKFNDRLEQAYDRWAVEIKNETKKPIIENLASTIKDIQRLFDVRHVVVHELPNELVFEKYELDRLYKAVMALIQGSNAALSQELHPNAPLQQVEMTKQAGEKLQEETEKLNEIVTKLRTISGKSRTRQLDDAIVAWENFAEKFARFESDEYKGGTIESMIFALEKSDLQRLLTRYLEPKAQPLNC